MARAGASSKEMTDDDYYDYDRLDELGEDYAKRHENSPAARDYIMKRVQECVRFVVGMADLATEKGFDRGEFGMILTSGIELMRNQTKNKDDFEKWFTVVRKQARDVIESYDDGDGG
jgi:hypothetical protein